MSVGAVEACRGAGGVGGAAAEQVIELRVHTCCN